MVELREKSPCAELLPVTLGTVTAQEVAAGPIASLSPFGDASALAAALQKAHGVAMPKAGETTAKGDLRCIWFGMREVLLMGGTPDPALRAVAAVVDQSDAWAVVDLHGSGAVDVLARLVPLDLRESAFAVGQTARTQVVHMSASITRLEVDRFRIMVFRSMGGTLVHDLSQAMAAVAARG